jgi:DNA-directed RNA polymerase subunit H (RpoH/RPB5)
MNSIVNNIYEYLIFGGLNPVQQQDQSLSTLSQNGYTVIEGVPSGNPAPAGPVTTSRARHTAILLFARESSAPNIADEFLQSVKKLPARKPNAPPIHVVLVSEKQVKHELAVKLVTSYTVTNCFMRVFSTNLPTHTMSCKHEIVNMAETDLDIDTVNIMSILVNDPWVIWTRGKVGDIYRIYRIGVRTTGQPIAYRRCVR